MEFPREVQRVEYGCIGVDTRFGVGDVVADERDAVGHGTETDVGRQYRCLLGEAGGDVGPCADTDLDEVVETGETGGECVGEGTTGGPMSGVHVGTFMIGAS